MAKLYVVKVTNGTIETASEWNNNPKGAKVSFHQICATLWNEDDVITGEVKILDENLNRYEGYEERITHPAPTED